MNSKFFQGKCTHAGLVHHVHKQFADVKGQMHRLLFYCQCMKSRAHIILLVAPQHNGEVDARITILQKNKTLNHRK
jgi:hypothetical protein